MATDTIHAPLCPKSLSDSASVPQTEIAVYSGYYTGESACLSGAYTLNAVFLAYSNRYNGLDETRSTFKNNREQIILYLSCEEHVNSVPQLILGPQCAASFFEDTERKD